MAGHIPVTTNYMGFFKPLDYFAWAREQDLCSTDNYPDPADPDSPMLTAMHYDLIRSLKKDVPWTVMEQTTFRVNWRPVNAAKVPGEMRRGSYQALARGAAGILFFQWRASAAGAEKFHSAMLGHAGTATPAWREVIELGEELQRLGELTTATGGGRLRDPVLLAELVGRGADRPAVGRAAPAGAGPLDVPAAVRGRGDRRTSPRPARTCRGTRWCWSRACTCSPRPRGRACAGTSRTAARP